ncbi:aromatic acid exporter family protein [Scatolibacter rhodanostii]|uniref:aromatic acid exporter family protein n=1 Tax=Scatolibacter rhodanostii TaxID=2014781 RepID=UPI000C089FC2|nr:aromatic acid exporter family protein [Scatolibacter rhodanostii]
MKSISSKFKKIAKATFGACIAIFIAQLLGLIYAPSAGIITLLSLQETKKETLRTALQRLIAFLTAVALAKIAFSLLGYNLLGFVVYLLFFAAFCYFFSVENALAMCSVLITHFWAEKVMDFRMFGNELLLLLIGAGVGILMNIFLSVRVDQIRRNQKEIDEVIKTILISMANGLSIKQLIEIEEMNWLAQRLKAAKEEVDRASGNALTLDLRYYGEYIDMRRNQYLLLKRIQSDLIRLETIPEQAEQIATFLRKIVSTFGESNNAECLLASADKIRDIFRSSQLPQTREEFEARAILLQIFDELEHFLLLKYTFAHSLSEEQKEQYWTS